MSDTQFTTTTFSGSTTTDTFGWDTVYAIHAGVVNDSLKEYFAPGTEGASMLQFSANLSGSAGIAISGQFGAWQLTTGGAGSLIRIKLPVLRGSASFSALGMASPLDLAGAEFIAEVRLGFHAVPGNATTSGQKAALKVATDGTGTAAGNAVDIQKAHTAGAGSNTDGQSPVTMVGISNLDLAKCILGEMIEPLLQQMVSKWLTAHLADARANNTPSIFDYAFLHIDVATEAKGEWAWITPTYVGYAFITPNSEKGNPLGIEQSVLAILAMTEHRVPAQLSAEVSCNAIPSNPGVNAGFSIAPARLMEKIILPNMASLFKDAKPEYFVLDDRGLSVKNTQELTLDLQMDPKWYTPVGDAIPSTDTYKATITPGNVRVSIGTNTVFQSFSLSYKYGYNSELTVDMVLMSDSTIGLDENKQFTMQYGHTTSSSINVVPDATKLAVQALIGIGVNLVVTALCCFTFGAAGEEVSSAAGPKLAGEPVGEGVGPKAMGEGAPKLTAAQESAASSFESEVMGRSASAEGKIPLQTAPEAIGGKELGTNAGAELVQEIKNPTTWSLKGMMPRFTFKLWAMFVGQFAGEIAGNLSNIDMIKAYDQPGEKTPTLEHFLANCIKPAVWTNTADQTLVSAGLNGAFVMGFAVASPANQSKRAAA